MLVIAGIFVIRQIFLFNQIPFWTVFGNFFVVALIANGSFLGAYVIPIITRATYSKTYGQYQLMMTYLITGVLCLYYFVFLISEIGRAYNMNFNYIMPLIAIPFGLYSEYKNQNDLD